MGIFRVFGIGDSSIFRKGCITDGTVTKVEKVWWLKIKTKPVRLYATPDNTVFPYVITFSYSIQGVGYCGKRYIPVRYRVPERGEIIPVYYDPEKPKNYAIHALGPGITQIEW